MSRPATQEEADALSQYLCQRFHAFRVRKNDLPGIKVIEHALDVARALGADLPSGDDFVNRVATTIGNMIMIPDGLDPDGQMELMVHETTHVDQLWTGGQQTGIGGGFSMLWLYTVEPEARVRCEVEAYRAQWEWLLARGRALPSTIDEVAFPLEHGYMLNDGQRQLGRDLLEAGVTTASKGIASTRVAQAAIDWAHRSDRHLVW